MLALPVLRCLPAAAQPLSDFTWLYTAIPLAVQCFSIGWRKRCQGLRKREPPPAGHRARGPNPHLPFAFTCLCETRAPQCHVLGMLPAQRHSSPSKPNSGNHCVGILGVNPLRILLKCSAVRQEWWVNTRWWPTLILVSVPLVFLGQGEMNSKDSYEAC